MNSLSLRAAAVAAALLPVWVTAAPLTLDDALQRATQRSEAARSARAGVSSASEAAHAAGQLPDPMLGVSLENLPVTGPDRFSTTSESMTMKRIALSQEWVSAEKRQLRTNTASAMVARESTSLASAVADARLQTALAYVDAYYAGELANLAATGVGHAREATAAAKGRVAAGGLNAQDVLAVSAVEGATADEAAEARQQFTAAAVTLARWTGTDSEELGAPALPPIPSEQQYVDGHPSVAAKRRDVEVARSDATLASANRRPNWTFEVAYGQRTGYSDLMSVGVRIPLPIAPAGRQDRETASKFALVERAEGELAEATRAAQGEYRALHGDASRLQERIRAYETGVLAPSTQRTAAARASYAGSQAILATVFEARRAELEARRKLLMLRRELAKVLAQLTFKPLTEEHLQ
jgi:outer membrane protein, heavy metal efflux system